jgi:hypothetical protein
MVVSGSTPLRDPASSRDGAWPAPLRARYTPAVCVSFTVPTLAIGKLRVCLEN